MNIYWQTTNKSTAFAHVVLTKHNNAVVCRTAKRQFLLFIYLLQNHGCKLALLQTNNNNNDRLTAFDPGQPG